MEKRFLFQIGLVVCVFTLLLLLCVGCSSPNYGNGKQVNASERVNYVIDPVTNTVYREHYRYPDTKIAVYGTGVTPEEFYKRTRIYPSPKSMLDD